MHICNNEKLCMYIVGIDKMKYIKKMLLRDITVSQQQYLMEAIKCLLQYVITIFNKITIYNSQHYFRINYITIMNSYSQHYDSQSQHYDHHQQNVHLQQLVMHQLTPQQAIIILGLALQCINLNLKYVKLMVIA